MAIIHNPPCNGVILFETRQQAVERLTRAGQPIPPEPREFRQVYCSVCGRHWQSKRAMWVDAHPSEGE